MAITAINSTRTDLRMANFRAGRVLTCPKLVIADRELFPWWKMVGRKWAEAEKVLQACTL